MQIDEFIVYMCFYFDVISPSLSCNMCERDIFVIEHTIIYWMMRTVAFPYKYST